MKHISRALGYDSSRMVSGIYAHALALVFCILFCAPIVSPKVGDYTIYLFWLIPLVDVGFVRHISVRLSKKVVIAVCIGVSGALLSGNLIAAAKVLTMVTLLAYLGYLRRVRLFHYLFLALLLAVMVATVQYVIFFGDPALARALGPEAISAAIWGELGKGNTNFYATEFTGRTLHRVSGLSAESGFFNALVVAALLIYVTDRDASPKAIWMVSTLLIGVFVSLSKIGLGFLFFAVLLYPMRRVLRSLNGALVLVAIVIALSVLFSLAYLGNFHAFATSETWIHRTNGYFVIWQLDLGDILFGTTRDELLSRQAYLIPGVDLSRFQYPVTGLPRVIAELGLLGLVAMLGAVFFVRASGFKAILYVLLTFSVSPLTSDSFAVLAAMYLTSRDFGAPMQRHRRRLAGLPGRWAASRSETGLESLPLGNR